MRVLTLAVLLLTSLSACSASKVLAFLPFPMKSHQIIFNSMLAELVKKGHDVTAYNSVPLHTNATNYKHVHVTSRLENSLASKYSFENIKSKLDIEAFIRPMGFQILTSDFTEEILSQPQIKDLLNSKDHFDVIILETFFGQEAFIGLAHKFKAPVVTLSTFGTYSLPDSVLGNPNPLSYISTYQLAFTNQLTFYQKLKNVVATLSEHHYSYFHHLPKQEAVMTKHFNVCVNSGMPSLMDLLTNISLVLLNTQPEVSYARPWVPNMIPVGGFHIEPYRNPLPKDIKDFLDGAEEGVIYFSLGSTFSGATMPNHIKEAFIASFKKLQQRVLWKIDIHDKNLPKNLKVSPWVQQNDVLAHPKVVTFITHGGLLSLIEAVHFAVPLITVPVFADQPYNAIKAEQAEIGLRLRVLNITEESVSWALSEIINNPKYKQNVVTLSAQMRDRPVSPMQSAVFWIEYVARHHGAPHFLTPAARMSSFHYLLLDIVAFTLVTLLLILSTIYYCVRRLSRILGFGSAKKTKND